jgi:hypothetical protein
MKPAEESNMGYVKLCEYSGNCWAPNDRPRSHLYGDIDIEMAKDGFDTK